MALNTRLTQNIDLQADSGTLVKALGSIETMLNNIVKQGGELGKAMDTAGKKGQNGFNSQLKAVNLLIAQAQNLTKILDAQRSQKAGKLFDNLDVQAIGKKGAAASRLTQDLNATSTAADVLERRLATLNKRFAEITLAGRTVGQRDLAKQLKTQEALKDVQGLERAFQRLNGQAGTGKGTAEQKTQMAALRAEIEKANAEIVKMGQGRRIDFTPQINQIRQLTEQYRQAVTAAVAFDRAQPGRTQTANKTAVGILNTTDAQRLAQIKTVSSQFQFPSGVSQTISQQKTESLLAESLNKRLRLLNMIQAAQDRGAPTRSVERLNDAYKKLAAQLGENFKRLTQVNAEINKQEKSSFGGQVMAGLGRAGIITGASIAVTGVYAVMNAVKEATKFVVEYEAALKQLQAISGSTDQQMKVLSTSIGEVGRNSTYSILEITKAATVIAQAGYSAKETGDVLKSAINLSTASGSDPTQSVEVLTAALGAFQLQASESDRVVDTLVTGLNKSKLSIEQMGSAIQYAGATANEAGVRFEELTTIAASMANAGIKSGSTIGTGIRQLLVDMQNPSEDFKKELKDVGLTLADVDVKAKGFAGVVKTLAEAGFTAEAAYASFETRAASAFLAFKGQIGTYDQLALAIAQGGAAAEAQAKAMDSLSAQWTRLKNDLSVLVAGLMGPLLSSLKVIVSMLAAFVEGIMLLTTPIANAVTSLGAFGTVLSVVAATLTGFFVGGPVGAAIGFFLGLTSAVGSAGSEFDELRTKTSDAEAKLNSQTTTVNSLDDAIEGLVNRQSTLKDGSVALQTETVTLSERFGDLYSYLGKAAGSYDELLNAMLRYRGAALQQQKLEAQSLQTNATIELNAARKRLADTSGGNGGSWIDRANVEVQLNNAPTNDKAAQGILNRARSALSSDDISTVTTAKNDVAKYNAAHNGEVKSVLAMLEERLGIIKQIASLQSQVTIATQQINVAEAAQSPGATSRNKSLIRIDGATDTILSAAKGGNRTAVNPAIAAMKTGIAAMKADLATMKQGSGQWMVLSNDLQKAESNLARLVRDQREADEAAAKVRPDRAQKGTNMTGTQVKSEILKAFPKANVYSEKPRSLETQTRLYNDYKAGRGPLAAKPGTSKHGSGHAVDITPIPGMTLDNMVSFIEGLGLEMDEKPLNELNPSTGKYHWHISWKPKSSSYGTREVSAQKQALQELKDAQASQAVSASSAEINAIMAQAKAGTINATTGEGTLKTAITKSSNAQLDQYDMAHPIAGLTGDALALQQLGRKQLLEKLAADAVKFMADFQRNIGDYTSKFLQSANDAIDKKLEDAKYKNDAQVRTADSKINISQNSKNRGKIDAGTSFYLEQQKEQAEINRDRANVEDMQQAENEQRVQLAMYAAGTPKGAEKSEERIAYENTLATGMEKINALMRERVALQKSINDRTADYVAVPLEERLKSAGQAWLQNSGAMKDWQSVLVDNVGPAADMLTNTLSGVFEGIAKGSMTIKQALGNILSSIGDFIIQMIAKALALQAVKWLLQMVGITVPDTPTGMMAGGQVKSAEHKPLKLLGGGSAGYINSGVSNKDTVPILGARGEYMLRSAAVKDIGVENVEQMNRHGAKAVSKMGGSVVMPAPSRQEVNVYVVKPDEKPQLSKGDIVLAITDDMLQGGQTKQLVRQISQGA